MRILIAAMVISAAAQADVPVPFRIEEAAQVSVAVYQADGKRLVRTLMTGITRDERQVENITSGQYL